MHLPLITILLCIHNPTVLCFGFHAYKINVHANFYHKLPRSGLKLRNVIIFWVTVKCNVRFRFFSTSRKITKRHETSKCSVYVLDPAKGLQELFDNHFAEDWAVNYCQNDKTRLYHNTFISYTKIFIIVLKYSRLNMIFLWIRAVRSRHVFTEYRRRPARGTAVIINVTLLVST